MRDFNTDFTQKCIVDSLILLIQEQDYDTVTMADISARSGISRRTIYRYYDNKLAILKAYIDGLIGEYWKYVTARIRSGENIVENSFQFIADHFEFFKIAYNNNLLINIMDILREVIAQVVRYSDPKYFTLRDDEYFDNYVSYVAGGCWGILCNWIQSDRRRPPREMYLCMTTIAHDLASRLAR